jgi:hypothetical protein
VRLFLWEPHQRLIRGYQSLPYKDPARQREYQRIYAAEKRRKFFIGKTCVRCGTANELTIDHIDPITKISHNVWSWSETRRNAELEKCQILCWPCHKTKTHLSGEKARGDASGSAKLSSEDVLEIRSLVQSGVSMRSVAYMFLVDEKSIRELIAGRTWKHVPL